MVALGGVREAIGLYAAGKDQSDIEPEEFLLGAIDRSVTCLPRGRYSPVAGDRAGRTELDS